MTSIRLAFIAFALLAGSALGNEVALPPINDLIVRNIQAMPVGGSYSTARYASIRLQSSTHFESGKIFVLPSSASPSFCSGATYLIFLKTIEQLRRQGDLELDYATLLQLMIRDQQKDGEGIWGRWNANGPGTARLFHELGIGKNFTDFDKALPGDFLKIFWTTSVGRKERGHSVIYLGTEEREDGQWVRFWSSNSPDGYGEKSVKRGEIAQAIFSRLTTPANLIRIDRAPVTDVYLAGLLSKISSFAEAKAKCGL